MALRSPASVVRNPVYGSPARMRVEREVARRSNAPVVISTLLSLLVVGAAVAAVAYLVLRSPSSPVDSAERLEPVGTALPAPSEPPRSEERRVGKECRSLCDWSSDVCSSDLGGGGLSRPAFAVIAG